MKKTVLFIAVLSAFSLASCKKDHTCTCVTTSTIPGSISTTDVKTYTKSKKEDARAACVSTSVTYLGYTTTNTCTLK
jgi:hypothetical protein